MPNTNQTSEELTGSKIWGWVFKIGTWSTTFLFLPFALFVFSMRMDLNLLQTECNSYKETVVTLQTKIDKIEEEAQHDRISQARLEEKLGSILDIVKELRRDIRNP